MAKKLTLLAVGALSCYAAAASAVVWSTTEEATFGTAYSFTYADKIGSSVDTTNVNEAKVLDFTVASSTKDAYAGYGIGWKQSCNANWECSDVAVSLSAYKGVCMTYTADAKFRLDFKQSTIKDNNYYGMDLDAAASPKSVFVAFKDLTKGWTSSSTVAWSAAAQLGIQISYKNTHAKASGGLLSNTVNISSFVLADSCITYAPELLEPYKSEVNPTVTLNEGDTLRYDLTELFFDGDGDDLTYKIGIIGEQAGIVTLADSLYAKTKILNLITGPNPQGSASVTITATDPSKKSASYSVIVETVDRENAPVAVDDHYETKEETKLTVSLKGNLLENDYDADRDGFTPELVETTAHGELVFDAETGGFTYTPEENFFGTDVFTYSLTEVVRASDSSYVVKTSNIATVTITVTNVDDPIGVTVVKDLIMVETDERNLGDTVVVDEDFGAFVVKIPTENVIFSDPDYVSTSVPVNVKTDDVVSAEYGLIGLNHVIEISSVADANGVAKVRLFAADGKDTASVAFFVKVNPVADKPVAVEDSYKVVQDTLNKVLKAKGVLANDKNPDGTSVLKAYLLDDAAQGTVELATDGSFTYDAGHFEGEDFFTYFIVNAEGDTSAPATVSLTVEYKNQPPQIVEGVLDTVGDRLAALKEDFLVAVRYQKSEVQSWFADDADAVTKLTFSARSTDSLLRPTFSSGVLVINSAKNVCGEADVVVTATDTKGASTDLVIPAMISCVEDKPAAVAKTATRYVGLEAAWVDSVNLNQYLYDPDGDLLTFSIVTGAGIDKDLKWEMEDSLLIITPAEGAVIAPQTAYTFLIWAKDATDSASTRITFVVDNDPNSIVPVLAAPKASWQSAILADRGVAAIFDMQGRVMWKHRLPVSEADVRNAAAQVQGRKILQVNKQTWTIR